MLENSPILMQVGSTGLQISHQLPWDLEFFSAFMESENNHYQAEQDCILNELQRVPHLF